MNRLGPVGLRLGQVAWTSHSDLPLIGREDVESTHVRHAANALAERVIQLLAAIELGKPI